MDDLLPDIHINVKTPLIDFLERIAEIARDREFSEVHIEKKFGTDEGYRILHLILKDPSPHGDLCGKLIMRHHEPGRVRVEVESRDWKPKPVPRYRTYCNAAKKIFDPLLVAYNRCEKKQLELIIQDQKDVGPRLPPNAHKLFRAFVANANPSGLHTLDWWRLYDFVRYSRIKKRLYADDIARLLVKEGFSEEYANRIGEIYEHLDAYKRRQVNR